MDFMSGTRVPQEGGFIVCKDIQRKEIEAQTALFLKGGGQIQQLEGYQEATQKLQSMREINDSHYLRSLENRATKKKRAEREAKRKKAGK